MNNNSRRAAAFIFARYLTTGEYPSGMLESGPDRAFIQDLVYTVVRRRRPLHLVLSKLLTKWPKGELAALLYIGAAQILYMPEIPDFAAVNETVDAAKSCPNPNIARVVNGVLRNLIRRREEIEALLASSPVEVRESFPSVLVRRWRERFGEANAEALCQWHNQPAEVFISRPGPVYEKVPRGVAVTSLPGFDKGEFIVQDPATAIAVKMMSVQPGERVLDACAAPGGKAVQLKWLGARVTACEVNAKRRRRMEANFQRLGFGDEVAIIGELPVADDANRFDRVLVDAPCSNSGVLRRRPDARWNWSEEKLQALVKLQAEILDRTAALVKPDGVLVYSTCSNEPEENMEQVQSFLSRHPEFRLIEHQESLPFETGMDGAFAAKFIKEGDSTHEK